MYQVGEEEPADVEFLSHGLYEVCVPAKSEFFGLH